MKAEAVPALSLSRWHYLFSSGSGGKKLLKKQNISPERGARTIPFVFKSIRLFSFFLLRGIGKQGFQCQGTDKLSFYFLSISSFRIVLLVILIHFKHLFLCLHSLQFCGPQKMSRVCDFHMPGFGGRPQSRRERLRPTFAVLFSICIALPPSSSSPSSLSNLAIKASSWGTRGCDSSPYIFVTQLPRPIADVSAHVVSSTRPWG